MEFIPENPLVKVKPDTLEVLRKWHNLDERRLIQSVDLLEEWAQKQSHFVRKQFRREYLEKRIIACKGSVEKAKAQIDKLCTLRTLLPKFFVCQNLKERFSQISHNVACLPLPLMTEEYQRIYVMKVFEESFESHQVIDFFTLNIVIAEYLYAHDYPDGFILIADLRDANLTEILRKINFIEFQQFVTILIEGFGARVKGIHVISESKVIDIFIKTIKPFLPLKIANRINVHQDIDSVHQNISKEILPVDFGGSLKSLRELQADTLEEIWSAEHEKYLETMVETRTDESLRNIEEFNEKCMGLPGSFRTLTVD